MNRKDYDTTDLWRLFISIVNLLVILIIITVMYVALEDQIMAFINKPKYTIEQLEEISKIRDRIRSKERNENWDLIENGIHVKTGLIADENLQLVIGSCTSCHSAKLITQNKATREGWKSMFVWMEETQGLTNLGDREPKILDYLEKHYAPQEIGRRQNLDIESIEWYILNLE